MYTNKLGCFVMIEYIKNISFKSQKYCILNIFFVIFSTNDYSLQAKLKIKEMDKNYKSDPQYT